MFTGGGVECRLVRAFDEYEGFFANYECFFEDDEVELRGPICLLGDDKGLLCQFYLLVEGLASLDRLRGGHVRLFSRFQRGLKDLVYGETSSARLVRAIYRRSANFFYQEDALFHGIFGLFYGGHGSFSYFANAHDLGKYVWERRIYLTNGTFGLSSSGLSVVNNL